MHSKWIILFTFFLTSSLNIDANWRIFMYMDSSDELSNMAFKNLSDILAACPNESIDIRIQLHSYGTTGLRYQICNNTLTYEDATILTGNCKNDLIAAAEWGLADNQSDHTMVILWNHGWGILDPKWNSDQREWQLDEALSDIGCAVNRSFIENKELEEIHRKWHKGFMFSSQLKSYLNNQDLVEALSFIRERILKRKIDVLAFDTCMGAMLEVAHQVSPYADYLVGNQTCSMADGFNYCGIISALNTLPQPCQAVAKMVEAFNDYYNEQDEAGIYTHSAINLSRINDICKAIDAIFVNLATIPDHGALLRQAARRSPRFCLFPMYTDLVAFFKQVEEQLRPQAGSIGVSEILNLIQKLYKVVDACVVARCGGSTTQDNTHGLAIYLPDSCVDSSYYTTSFAQSCLWLESLQKISNNLNTSDDAHPSKRRTSAIQSAAT